MPIPAALAARLAKRGIVHKKAPRVSEELTGTPAALTPAPSDEVEEVFAEDYDELETATVEPETETQEEDIPEPQVIDEEEETLIHEASACPNKTNSYHQCTDYCRDRWGNKEFDPDPIIDHKRLHMLKKYPLPEGWEEVGDPETGRYYYWNMNTDEVSWLSPIHPRTQISLSEERLKELLDGSQGSDHHSEDEDEGDIMDIDDFEEIERKILMEKSVKEKEKKQEKKRRAEPLDPMDPAAYSDIARGNWASGLEQKGSAKTGVDSTASGPLFQQRPYPSPGAILRMNKKLDD